MAESDDQFGDDPDEEKFAETFGRHCDALYDRISEYMEQAELDEAYAAQLLIELMLRMRMTAYAIGVESPSVSGLKLDLDRLGRELDTYLREAKKNADEYIRHVKEMRALGEEADEEQE
jgi:adenine-specific DNA methylase